MPHLLVVDDEEFIRSSLKYLLENEGYSVDAVSDYFEASDQLSSQRYEAAIVDVLLPKVEGTRLLQDIHDRDPDLPVILITGAPGMDSALKAVRYKAFDYISKPVDPEELLRIIQKAVNVHSIVLENRKLQEQNARYQRNLEEMVETRTHQLEESRAKYQDLFEHATNAMFLIDGKFDVFDVNHAGQTILGQNRDQILNRNLQDIFGVDVDQDHMAREKVALYEVDFCKKGQNNCVLEIYISQINFRGQNGVFYHCIARDISDRKKAEETIHQKNEELRQKNAQLQIANKIQADILNIISHELRTPLTIIAASAEILRDFDDTMSLPERRNCIEKITNQVAHQSQIIDQLLLATRLFRGELQVRRQPVDVNALARMLADGHMPDFLDHNVDLSVIHYDHKIYADADEKHVMHIVENILDNALKFTPAGGAVTIKVERDDENVLISVQDTGIGISPQHHQAIFEQFFQVESSTTRHYSGLGLGLAVTRELVRLNDGDIIVDSTYGQGSTFRVQLPFHHEEAQVEPTSAETKPPSDQCTVLIADDNKDVIELLRISLSRKNYRVITALNGVEALKMVESEPVDLMILDLMMPDMDGFSVCEKMKTNAATHDIPIIVLTGQAREEERNRALMLGVNEYMVKPFKRDQIIQMIDAYTAPKSV